MFRLVDDFCSTEQITNLLRTVRGTEAIKITAPNKQTLIHTNLRTALERGVIPVEKVYDLVREAEENGTQYIFFYRPAGVMKTLTVPEIGVTLWGRGWEQKMRFPRVDLVENRFIYADLRPFLPDRKPLDWVLKIYGHEIVDRATGVIQELGNNRFTREYVREDRRMVILVRWNNPGLLEIRLPRLSESRKQLLEWLKTTWGMVAPALTEGMFVRWDLVRAQTKMLEEQRKHQKLYRCSNSRIKNADQKVASYECMLPEDDLFSSEGVEESVKAFKGKKDGNCTQMRVTWLQQKNDTVPTREVVTLLGHSEDRNRVLFTGQCTSKDVDYVTEQLRFFSK